MPARPQARLLKGFRDIFGEVIPLRRWMIDVISRVYERYGFQPLETPTIEYADVLGKYLPDADLPEGGTFAFRDEKKHWVALRYDLTAPLSRVVAQYPELPQPYRRYQVGLVYRQEKPEPGRFREFYQCDFDTVGTPSMAADAEVCCILSDALEELGISQGNYLIRVNNRKVLNGVLEKADIPITSEAGQERQLVVLRAIDKLDRLGWEGVADLLGKGRRDESGDFTPGAELSPKQIETIHAYLSVDSKNRAGFCDDLASLVGDSEVGREGVEELRQIDELLTSLGYGENRVIFDPTLVRGLAYYTGPVFEAVLTFGSTEESGEGVSVGSVAGGGRYDDLVERFLGKSVPATGASIGVDRLLVALQQKGLGPAQKRLKPVLVTVMDKSLMSEYFRIAAEFHRVDIPAEVYLGGSGLRAQLKYADRRGLAVAVICGEDEFSKNEVSIKDLAMGRKLSESVKDREEWTQTRPAQVTVSREEMIPTVQKILEQEE